MTNTIHGPWFFLWHRLGILYQILHWYFKIGGKFSPHQISPFLISHVPNFPFPGICKLDFCQHLASVGWWPRGGGGRPGP